jgi:hypothetical protein
VYGIGKFNTLLSVLNITTWIFNALFYAIVFCLLVYLVARPTFHTWGVYDAGTVIFTGLCNTLQLKVAFYHHQWNWLNIFVMSLSVCGMLLYFLLVSVAEYDYYYVANYVYLTGFFWFYSFFTLPIFVAMIDYVFFYTRKMFAPSNRMLFEEVANEVGNTHTIML